MISSRVALLAAFGVGCLSTALLFGFWRADGHEQGGAMSKARPRSADVVRAALVAPKIAPRAEASDDSARAAQRAEPVDAVKAEPPATADATEVGNAPPGGSAVSDVLTDLEAAYRQRLIAAARAEAAARDETEAPSDRTAPPPTSPPQVEARREVVAQAVAPVAPPPPPPAAVAPAAPPVEPPPSVAIEVPPTAAIVAQNDARPVDVHIGDVNQNTYITNVRQGDVYVIQQQLAMLNYMQMAGAAAYPGMAQVPHAARGVVQHQPPQNQFRQFPSTLTNLDNPWGFNFAPPNLVH